MPRYGPGVVAGADPRDDGAARPCCGPARGGPGAAPVTQDAGASAGLRADLAAMLRPVPGGRFHMGTDQPRYRADGDAPARAVTVSPFLIGATQITNALFERFVHETGYRTIAERDGWSFVFHLFAPNRGAGLRGPVETPWWRALPGADWRHPEGPGSDLAGRADDPVLHVSWDDAAAFCAYTGTRLPREAEWECAARGGLEGARFPWGDDPQPDGAFAHHVWQGRFPMENTAEDGFAGVAPARSFRPNGYGLFHMTGNVWDWCADWFGALPVEGSCDPRGPDQGPGRVMRGGSHLCHASYCERYFVHSRSHNTPDSSTGHIGFRVVADPGYGA